MFWNRSPKDSSPSSPPSIPTSSLPSTSPKKTSSPPIVPPEETLMEKVTGTDDTTDSSIRYAAYATRVRTILQSAHRYVAYTSDIGESFRPVAHPYLVRAAYGISWAYILGDVSYEGYKAYWRNQHTRDPSRLLTTRQERWTGMRNAEHPLPAETLAPGVVAPEDEWRLVMVQRAVFQSVASMGLPALTIHSVVKYSGRAMKNVKHPGVRTWAPIGLGLAVVPFLPRLFDEPVEHAVAWAFTTGARLHAGVPETPDLK